MENERDHPPAMLANASVLEYARTDDRVGYSSQGLLVVNGVELGLVPCLAICQNLEASGVLLLFCNRNWVVQAAEVHSSVERAKERVERIYPGVSERWRVR